MALKLINGLFYFEHTFNDIDNQALIDEIKYKVTTGNIGAP